MIHLLFEKDDLRIRLLQQEDNYFLAKWLSDPAVLEYYEGRDKPFDVKKVDKVFYNRNNDVVKCMVEYKGRNGLLE